MDIREIAPNDTMYCFDGMLWFCFHCKLNEALAYSKDIRLQTWMPSARQPKTNVFLFFPLTNTGIEWNWDNIYHMWKKYAWYVKMRQNTYETLVLHTMQLINSHYEWETNTGKMCDKCVGTRFVFNDWLECKYGWSWI